MENKPILGLGKLKEEDQLVAVQQVEDKVEVDHKLVMAQAAFLEEWVDNQVEMEILL